MKPTLLILAAGMGSRFGGLKQITPVGPSGETIIEYSIFDAIRAGFGKVVFVIRESFADEFKERFDKKLFGKIDIEYVYQELDKLPDGYILPEGREKPWGTAHAIMMGKEAINEPFAALNADDFYGFEAFKTMSSFLQSSDSEAEYSMVGYQLRNTLSDFGTVSRGVCEADQNNYLSEIIERIKIYKKNSRIVYQDEQGNEVGLTGNEKVSMNIWGFKPNLFGYLEKEFTAFLDTQINVPKSEIYIPSVVFELIEKKQVSVKILEADSPWFGVTYKEDHPEVVKKIKQMVDDGIYPENLWNI